VIGLDCGRFGAKVDGLLSARGPVSDTAARALAIGIAQAAFEDFSGIFAWQAAADFDAARHFVACEVLIP